MKEKNSGKGKRQILLVGIWILMILLASGVFASSIHFFCINRGDTIEYSKCNPKMSDKTCTSDHCNNICVNQTAPGVYCPTDPNFCNALPCLGLGDNGSADNKPPIIVLKNPLQGSIYNKRTVLFNVELNEISDVYYTDLINGRGRWTMVCKDCKNYSKERSFNEGLNIIQIKAIDLFGNTAYKNVSFLLDSKKPQIHATEPRNGFATGQFLVQYTEDHIYQVSIDYGNTLTGMRSAILSGCVSGAKKECSINLNVKDYDGQEIYYWFTVRDTAGNIILSKKTKLTVDTTFPVINNPNSFWKQGIGKDNKYLSVNLSITETNLDSVEYQDVLDIKPTWKTLCTSLKKGFCYKKITLNAGAHKLNFQITDEAGNAVPAETTQFTVV
jgi:hypothetical protein